MKALPNLDDKIHKAWYATVAPSGRSPRDLTSARDWHVGLRIPEEGPLFVWRALDIFGGSSERYELPPESYPHSRNAHPRGEY